jgi:hypothetical protein
MGYTPVSLPPQCALHEMIVPDAGPHDFPSRSGIPPQAQYAQAERQIDDFNRLVSELTSPDGLLGAKVGRSAGGGLCAGQRHRPSVHPFHTCC